MSFGTIYMYLDFMFTKILSMVPKTFTNVFLSFLFCIRAGNSHPQSWNGMIVISGPTDLNREQRINVRTNVTLSTEIY